jgi:hypothetical protein
MTSDEQRIVDVVLSLGYKNFTKGTTKRRFHVVDELRFVGDDGHGLGIVVDNLHDYEVSGIYPIVDRFINGPTDLRLRKTFADRTLKKKIEEFRDQYLVAYAAAVEQQKRKQNMEDIAATVTEDTRKELGIRKANASEFEVTVKRQTERDDYEFVVQLRGFWTPKELGIIIQNLQDHGIVVV